MNKEKLDKERLEWAKKSTLNGKLLSEFTAGEWEEKYNAGRQSPSIYVREHFDERNRYFILLKENGLIKQGGGGIKRRRSRKIKKKKSKKRKSKKKKSKTRRRRR